MGELDTNKGRVIERCSVRDNEPGNFGGIAG